MIRATTDASLAFVDCETTGVHPGRLPWEIAIIRREPDGTEETCHLQIADVDLSNADPFGLKIGGFYQRHGLVGGNPGGAAVEVEREAALLVERYTRGAHLVGAVPNFDAETFDAMLRRHRLVPAWHYHLIDVEALAVGYVHGVLKRAIDDAEMRDEQPPAFKGQSVSLPWKSDDLSRACGVEPPSEEDWHTALGDARWAKRWYDAITGRTQPPAIVQSITYEEPMRA